MHISTRKDIYRITFIGFIINILLTIFKFSAGILGRSSAMIADAVHSLSDLASDIIVLIFARIAGKPVDESHRYGHGKFETFSTFIVGVILAFAGIGILWEAVSKIIDFFNGELTTSPEIIALIAAAVSIIVKEILFWATLKVGKTQNSQMVIANAWHHRTDAMSSVATLFGIGGAIFLGKNWIILDPLAAGLVSIFIIRVAYKIIKPAVNDLLERSLPPDTRDEIISIVSSTKDVQNPHNIRTRRIGNNFAIEIHIYIDKDMSVQKSHDVTLVVEQKLKDRFGEQTHVVIHVDPAQ